MHTSGPEGFVQTIILPYPTPSMEIWIAKLDVDYTYSSHPGQHFSVFLPLGLFKIKYAIQILYPLIWS